MLFQNLINCFKNQYKKLSGQQAYIWTPTQTEYRTKLRDLSELPREQAELNSSLKHYVSSTGIWSSLPWHFHNPPSFNKPEEVLHLIGGNHN